MKKDTVTLKTDTLAELMGMALLAANAGLLPADTYEEWFKLRFRREIEFTIDGLKNGWGREDIGALNNLTDSWVQRFKARKTFEKNLEACFGETVKYPELNPLEARQYEILMHKRDKVEALIKLLYDVIGFDEEHFKPFPCEAAKEQYYHLVEAIIKGGCNKR